MQIKTLDRFILDSLLVAGARRTSVGNGQGRALKWLPGKDSGLGVRCA